MTRQDRPGTAGTPDPDPVPVPDPSLDSGPGPGPGSELGALAQARERLEEAQERVIAALVSGAAAPEGFDRARLDVQARSLVAKRRSVVARLRPDAAVAVGADLAAEFAAYAAARATPPPGYRADADDFAAWLRAKGRMPRTSKPGDPVETRRFEGPVEVRRFEGWVSDPLGEGRPADTWGPRLRGWWARLLKRTSERRSRGDRE